MKGILVSFEEWKKGYFPQSSSFIETFLIFYPNNSEDIFILLLNKYICS